MLHKVKTHSLITGMSYELNKRFKLINIFLIRTDALRNPAVNVRVVRFGQCIEGIFDGHFKLARGPQVGNHWFTIATDGKSADNGRVYLPAELIRLKDMASIMEQKHSHLPRQRPNTMHQRENRLES
jgi:hypothetical protein